MHSHQSQKTLFDYQKWNHFKNSSPKTNNDTEGFHRKLSKLFNGVRPSFYQILESSINILFQIEAYLDRLDSGMLARLWKKIQSCRENSITTWKIIR